jgi:hypothetical protein
MKLSGAKDSISESATALESLSGLRRVVARRTGGPGGYYNAGNLIGLLTGIVLQVGFAPHGATVWTYLTGSASSLALTAATLIFFASGEAYHRAWAQGFPPDIKLNRFGDLTSGIGALALGVGLLMLDQPIMAATSGLLHAAGKFGSAFHKPGASTRYDWCYAFRVAVVASRFPAMLAAAVEFARNVMMNAGPSAAQGLAAPLTLLVCYLLWLKADWLLLPKRDKALSMAER